MAGELTSGVIYGMELFRKLLFHRLKAKGIEVWISSVGDRRKSGGTQRQMRLLPRGILHGINLRKDRGLGSISWIGSDLVFDTANLLNEIRVPTLVGVISVQGVNIACLLVIIDPRVKWLASSIRLIIAIIVMMESGGNE